VRRFLTPASRTSRISAGKPPSSARSPSSRRPGRIAGRAGHSAPSPPPRTQVLPRAGLGETPFARASRDAGSDPHAAGAASRPHRPARKPDDALNGRERVHTRIIFQKMSTELCIKPGLFSCGRLRARVSCCRDW
jgi:hypothetical protein